MNKLYSMLKLADKIENKLKKVAGSFSEEEMEFSWQFVRRQRERDKKIEQYSLAKLLHTTATYLILLEDAPKPIISMPRHFGIDNDLERCYNLLLARIGREGYEGQFLDDLMEVINDIRSEEDLSSDKMHKGEVNEKATELSRKMINWALNSKKDVVGKERTMFKGQRIFEEDGALENPFIRSVQERLQEARKEPFGWDEETEEKRFQREWGINVPSPAGKN